MATLASSAGTLADPSRSVLAPVELMKAYGWSFRRLEQPGSDWYFQDHIEDWLQQHAPEWQLQDHRYFQNNRDVHDCCNTMLDAWHYTQPHVHFATVDHALLFKLTWHP